MAIGWIPGRGPIDCGVEGGRGIVANSRGAVDDVFEAGEKGVKRVVLGDVFQENIFDK